MDANRFDTLARALSVTRSRRGLAALFGGLLVSVSVARAPVADVSGAGKQKAKPKKCRKPSKKCGAKCVNVQTSVANCGGCGDRCPAGQSCLNGTCCAAGQRCGSVCCPAGKRCQGDACVTDDGGGGGGDDCAARCPNGCCDPVSGACQPGTGAQCGKGGEICTTCGSGQACRGQHCCGGNSTACDAKEDCCGDWVCERAGTCCTRNGGSVPSTTPLCCDGRDVVQNGRCCRETGDACETGNTCCGGASCVAGTCCRAVNSVCTWYDDDRCCVGLTCDNVRGHGILCCIPHDQPGCTADKDCCDATCVNGVCRQCGTLQTCRAASGQVFCCQNNETCCSDVSCARPGGECCNDHACDVTCDANGNCPF